MGLEDKFVVRLAVEEREQLQGMVDSGKNSKTVRQRARILLKADESAEGPGWTDERVAEFAVVSLRTVSRIRKRSVEVGFEAAVYRQPSLDRLYRKLDGAGEATLIATACSQAPEGRVRWTLKLLAEKLVALEVVETITPQCVGSVLKKTNCSLT